jgi:hypothetical protein
MRVIKVILAIIAIATVSLLLWIFLPILDRGEAVQLQTDIFETNKWKSLEAPVTVQPAVNYGRANPFAAYASISNEIERDELRLETIDKVRAGLQRFYDVRNIYPIGENIEIGSSRAGCLSALGWISEDACAVPSNPAANIQYARDLQPDPGISSIVYTRGEDEQEYIINFILETEEFLGQSGTYIANEDGIRKQK